MIKLYLDKNYSNWDKENNENNLFYKKSAFLRMTSKINLKNELLMQSSKLLLFQTSKELSEVNFNSDLNKINNQTIDKNKDNKDEDSAVETLRHMRSEVEYKSPTVKRTIIALPVISMHTTPSKPSKSESVLEYTLSVPNKVNFQDMIKSPCIKHKSKVYPLDSKKDQSMIKISKNYKSKYSININNSLDLDHSSYRNNRSNSNNKEKFLTRSLSKKKAISPPKPRAAMAINKIINANEKFISSENSENITGSQKYPKMSLVMLSTMTSSGFTPQKNGTLKYREGDFDYNSITKRSKNIKDVVFPSKILLKKKINFF